jgi:RNA polymerase sigma factor (sigma-70 family)
VTSELETPVVSDGIAGSVSFERFFTTHYTALARLLYRVVGDIQTAEELAAEAFWKLHVSQPKSERNLVGWLYRTGLRLALDSLRKRKRRDRYEALAARRDALPSPLEDVERREQQERIRKALAALKPVQISLLVLRGEGCTH